VTSLVRTRQLGQESLNSRCCATHVVWYTCPQGSTDHVLSSALLATPGRSCSAGLPFCVLAHSVMAGERALAAAARPQPLTSLRQPYTVRLTKERRLESRCLVCP